MPSEEYKALQQAANELGPRLEEELRREFPLARRYEVAVAYGAGLDKNHQLAMRFNIQSGRRLTSQMGKDLVAHAEAKVAEWQPKLKAEVNCAGLGRMD